MTPDIKVIHGEEVEFEIVEEGIHSYTEEVKRYAKLTRIVYLTKYGI